MNREKELLFDELYEKTKDYGRVQFINLLMEKEREIKELKKQLEKAQLIRSTCAFCSYYKTKEKMKAQQKEFIECLERELTIRDNIISGSSDEDELSLAIIQRNILAVTLKKYKKIIEVKDE